MTVFVSLVSTLRAEYSPDRQTIIGCPTQEQLAAILASVMHVQVRNVEKIVFEKVAGFIKRRKPGTVQEF